MLLGLLLSLPVIAVTTYIEKKTKKEWLAYIVFFVLEAVVFLVSALVVAHLSAQG